MELLKTILMIYVSVLGFGALFSGAMYFVDRQPVYRAHFLLWVASLTLFGSQAICSNLELTGMISFSTSSFMVIMFLHVFGLCFESPLPVKKYALALLAGLTISCLCFVANLPFVISSSPYILGIICICGHSIYLGMKNVPNSALRNGYLLLIGFTALHMADYPFFRPIPEMTVLSFSIALVMDFCYASFIPLAIVKTQAQRSTQLLEQKVLERTLELQNANLELQKVSDHNRALTSVLVHDLTNPISVVLNSLPRLESLLLTETDTKVFGRIARSMTTLADTTDRIRQEHAVRSGKKQASTSQAQLAEVIEKMASDFEGALNAKRLRLKIENHTSANLLVEAEPETLKNQILSNLLSNAIKFSHHGGTIAISTDVRDGQVVVRVQDDGVGVPLTMREEIFRDDRPTSSSGTNGESGTGFGLPIVRHFVRQVGGNVRVSDSLNGSGACFEVTLKKSA